MREAEQKVRVVAFVKPKTAKQFKAACAVAGTNMSEKSEELFSQFIREQLGKKAA